MRSINKAQKKSKLPDVVAQASSKYQHSGGRVPGQPGLCREFQASQAHSETLSQEKKLMRRENELSLHRALYGCPHVSTIRQRGSVGVLTSVPSDRGEVEGGGWSLCPQKNRLPWKGGSASDKPQTLLGSLS